MKNFSDIPTQTLFHVKVSQISAETYRSKPGTNKNIQIASLCDKKKTERETEIEKKNEYGAAMGFLQTKVKQQYKCVNFVE